ncbi:MAG: ABC transporter permease [Planctomycetota bacterium]|nr:ABC transporter permease [Planctomycetota bacterium]
MLSPDKSATRILLRRFIADYGMIFVLLILMAGFSFLTVQPQRPTGEAVGVVIADQIVTQFGNSAKVFIAVPGSVEDKAFADAARIRLEASGATVVAATVGSPIDARLALQKAIDDGTSIDAIALTGTSATWSVLDKFPELSIDRRVSPRTGMWPAFLKASNLIGVANQTAVYAVIAIGMTMVIITGGIDLSVGSLVALSSVIATMIIRDNGGVSASTTTVVFAFLIAVLAAAAAGAFNGMMVTAFQLPPFIVTLAMMLVARGLAKRLSESQSINTVPPSFRWLGDGSSLNVPNAILLMVVLYVLTHFIMSRSVFGRHLYAIGGNASASRLSGISVKRTTMFVYVICGALAGLGGIMLSSRLDAGDPKYGEKYELEVISAVVVGGTSLMGGEGRIFGTLIGAFIIAVIRNGMNLMGVNSDSQDIVLGVVLLLAVLLDHVKRTKMAAT